jgi:predicted transcriptional regulator
LSNQLSLPLSHEEPNVEKHSLLMNCNTNYHADSKIFSMITDKQGTDYTKINTISGTNTTYPWGYEQHTEDDDVK